MGYIHIYPVMSGILLNLINGSTTPQYNVVHDYIFTLVHISESTDWSE